MSGQQSQPPKPFRLEAGARRVEHEVDAELEFHLAMRTRKLIEAGLSPEAARERALELFGNLPAVRSQCLTIDREQVRSMNRRNYFDGLRQDIAHAFRVLRRSPGFTVTLLLILALGIGANTAVFSLIDALIRRPLPAPHAGQLVSIGNPRRSGSSSTGSPRTDIFSYPLYQDLRDRSHSTAGLYASGHPGRLDAVLAPGGLAEHPVGRLVSGNYFAVLQLAPAAGRLFSPAEDQVPGRDAVAVISYDYWLRHFAGERSVIGRVISVNRVPFTIIGVAQQGWNGDVVGQRTEIWLPTMMEERLIPYQPWLTDRSANWLLLMGRLAPRATLEGARAEFTQLIRTALLNNSPADGLEAVKRELRDRPIQVESGARGFSYYRSEYSQSLLILMAAVGLVLLVVCANVAHLLLARAAARGREMSVRMALGAGRTRLIQQLLTESVIVALAGGGLGLVVAVWGSAALLKLAGGSGSPIPLELHLDGVMLGFAALVSLLTAVLVGLVPAFRATRVPLATALRTAGRGVQTGNGKTPLGKALVVAQVALSLLLLVSTGMLLKSLRRLHSADLGLTRDSLLIARVDAGRSGYEGPRLFQLMRTLTARIEQIPGVAAVSFSENGIFSGTESGSHIQVAGFTAASDAERAAGYDDVGAGYFAAIGARLLQGRDFTAADNETGPKVAVVNQTMAQFYWKNSSPLGRSFRSDSADFTVVGVVGDVQGQNVRETPGRRFYVSAYQIPDVPSTYVMEIRGRIAPEQLIEPVRRAMLAVDPELAPRSIYPLSSLIGESLGPTSMLASVVSAFGALALLLAALGLYGVMAYAAVRRTSEFGLRIALGAAPKRIGRMVLREALRLVAGGIIVGLPLAVLAGRVLRSQLFGIEPVDPASIAMAGIVLGACALLAAYLPARRASRVAPLQAIRSE